MAHDHHNHGYGNGEYYLVWFWRISVFIITLLTLLQVTGVVNLAE